MTNILITGGAGFIGSSLADKMVEDPSFEVVIADNLLTGTLRRLPSSKFTNWKFIKADVNHYDDIAAIMLAHKFDYVFHYAAVVGVQRTLANPVMVLNDIAGIRNVLELSKNTGVKRVYFSSSSEVYGEPVEFPQNENTTPLNSRLTYAVVKNVGEAFLRSYHREFNLDYTIFRFFNTYGSKQSNDFVISRFIRAAVAGNDIHIYGDGQQTRTFCHIEDNVEATLKSLRMGHFINDVVNVGSDKEISILHLAETILELTKSRSRIVHLPALKEGDMTRRKPDISKMQKLLKRDLLPLEEGLRRIIRQEKHLIEL
jgi:nucleoside-diphosphate-sugar epimerase